MVTSAPDSPLLEQIHIASPCSVAWETMHGDDRSRFCGECRKRVYNIAAMSRVEAEELIRTEEGGVCGRLYRRADGTVLTADCPVGVRNFRRRLGRICVGVLLLGATLLTSVLHACGRVRAAQAVQESGSLAKLRESVEPLPPTFMGGGFFCVPSEAVSSLPQEPADGRK